MEGIVRLVAAFALLSLGIPDAAAQQFASRNPDKDFSTHGIGLGNKTPRGVWVDKERKVMLVLDFRWKKIFTYTLETDPPTRLDNHHNDKVSPTTVQIGRENTELAKAEAERDNSYIINEDDFFLFKENVAANTNGTESNAEKERRRDPYKKRTIEETIEDVYPMLPNPYGIWADGTTDDSTLWVSDFTDGKIYAYKLKWNPRTITIDEVEHTYKYATGRRDSDKDISLDADAKPHGICADETYLWVADNGADKILAFNKSTKARVRSEDIDLKYDDSPYPQGIWSDGTTIWVANIDEHIVYAYKISDGSRDPDKDYTALSDAGNDRPRGIFSDGETMWVVDQTDNKLYAYHAYSKFASRNAKQDFNDAKGRNTLKAAGNDDPKGMWADGETMWVADSSKDKLFAYNLANKERKGGKEFSLGTDVKFPQSLWSDGTTMWVLEFGGWENAGEGIPKTTGHKIYAFKLSDKSRDTSKEFNTLDGAGNHVPRGIWSNGTTMWVTDSQDGKIYAYNLATKSRDSSKDFNTLQAAGNTNPFGIWSDGATMWVADNSDGWIYAYKMTDKSRDKDKDFGTLNAAGNNAPFGIWSDKTTMWVLDSTDKQIYAYRLSNAASLGSLKLTGHVPFRQDGKFEVVELDPDFDSGTTDYIASVPYATERLTIEPKTLRSTNSNDRFTIAPTDSDATTAGHQVRLEVGDNPISITVTNGNTNSLSLPRTRTYTVNVKREFFTYNDPSKDISWTTNSILPDAENIRGLWSDGANMWISAQVTNIGKIYQYNLQSSNIVSTNLASYNADPRGLWSDGTTLWIANSSPTNRLYAYGLTNRERLNVANDFELKDGNDNPRWIWSDGVTMWVTDGVTNKIFAYQMSDKTRNPSRDIVLESGKLDSENANRTGMWSDGANLWIANSDINNAKIFAYKLRYDDEDEDPTNHKYVFDCREETKDFNTLKDAKNENPSAIFSDGAIMWVADSEDDKIYAYNQPLSGNAWLKTLTIRDTFYGTEPFKLSNPTITEYDAWVERSTASITISATTQENASLEIRSPDADANTADHQITLDAGPNNNAVQITVTSENGAINQIYTVNIHRINNDKRIPPLDFKLTAGNANPTGIWANDKNMWVLNSADDKAYAYKMSGDEYGNPDNAKTFEPAVGDQNGIWGNERYIWVADAEQNAILAYVNELTDGVFGKEDPSTPNNKIGSLRAFEPLRGLFGEGAILWLSNESQKLFAWNNLPDETRNAGEDKTLGNFAVGDNSVTPKVLNFWMNASTIWILDSAHKTNLYAYNRSDGTRADSTKDKDIALATENVSPRAIGSNGTAIWVADTEKDKIFAYRLPTSSAVDGNADLFFSEDSTLKSLQLSGITLTPAFSADNRHYSALADHTVTSTTVTATANSSGAEVDIIWGAAGVTRSAANRGRQVSLSEGGNIIAIDVLAESRTAQSKYLIRVTKAEEPPPSGGPLPLAPQSASLKVPHGTASASAIVSGAEGKARLLLAELMLDGGVRFVFAVPEKEEFEIEETVDLLGGIWRSPPEDEVKIQRESNGNGQDRLTVILPQADGKQRFLRLSRSAVDSSPLPKNN